MSGAPAERAADLVPARPVPPALYGLLIGAAGAAAVLGFVREAAVGALFGASRETDAFYAALTVPFVAAYFLVGGALAPPLTAGLARHLEAGDADGARRLLGAVLLRLAAIGVPGALLLGFGRHRVVSLLAPGFEEPARALTASLLLHLLPYGLLVSAALVGSAALTASGAYRTPALALLVGNALSVGVLASLGRGGDIHAAAWAMNVAALVMAVVPLARLAALKLSPRFAGGARVPWGESGLLALSLAAAGAVDLAERSYASAAGVGTVAVLAFASKLVHLPMRLVAAPLASVSFPRLVRSLLHGEGNEAGRVANGATALLLYAAAVTAGAAGPIAALTFGRGRFDAAAVAQLAAALALLAPAVVAVGFLELAAKYLVAARRTRAVVAAQVAGLATYLALAPLLAEHRVMGLAAARSAAWVVAAAGLALPLLLHERSLALFKGALPVLLAAVAAALAAAGASHLAAGPLLRCAAAAAGGAIAFAAPLLWSRRRRAA